MMIQQSRSDPGSVFDIVRDHAMIVGSRRSLIGTVSSGGSAILPSRPSLARDSTGPPVDVGQFWQGGERTPCNKTCVGQKGWNSSWEPAWAGPWKG